MKTRIFLIVIISFFCLSMFSQDIIYKNDGKRIYCQLTGQDSLNVYFNVTKKRATTESFISRADIAKIDYVTRLPYASSSDSIVTRNNNLYYQGKLMNVYDFTNVIKTNDAAYKKYKSANAPAAISNIFAGVGGGLIGYPIGTKLGGGEPDWTMAGIGAGLVAVAIPIAMISAKKSKEAINIYNKGVTPGAMGSRPKASVGFASTGVGFSIRF